MMDVEAHEDFMGSSTDLALTVKEKCAKRPRSSSTSSSGQERGVAVEECGYSYGSSSPTTSTEVYESTEEEEDMANCLILLAQGEGPTGNENSGRFDKFSDHTTVATISKAGLSVYECKTCNRSFPSFQALGGHRASHKKPKASAGEKKSSLVVGSLMDDLDDCGLNKSCSDHLPLSLHISTGDKANFRGNKAKTHECSICGSEFTSGQALGGHMRRHRGANSAGNQVGMMSIDASDDHQVSRQRNIIALDLNLPAPEDDQHHRESKFQFVSTQQAVVLSAPALVDCHY